MIASQFKMAVRVLQNQRFYSAINIIGFSLGMAVFFFLSIYLVDQYAFDRWVNDRDRVYRLELDDWALLGTAYGPYMKKNFPEVEDFTRISTSGYPANVAFQDDVHAVNHWVFADSTVFEVFPFEFITGNPGYALKEPASVVLTESVAMRIFGTNRVAGMTIRFNDFKDLVVTGVIRDVSHFHIEVGALSPFHLLADFNPGIDNFLHNWGSWNYMTYVKLKSGTDTEAFGHKINELFHREIYELFGMEMDRTFFLRPLTGIYFANDIRHISPVLSANRETIQLFLAIALFILLIAVVNFINLSTARSAARAREVGVKRLLGSPRGKLIIQFLSESVVITAVSVLLALILVEIGFPWFRDFVSISLVIRDIGWVKLVSILVLGTVSVGLLAGLYPSIYMTSVVPVDVLKGQLVRGRRGAAFRKFLIVFQFVISISLIVSSFVISDQLRYMENKDLGFRMEGIIHFQLNQHSFPRWNTFRERLLDHPSVVGTALSSQVPGYVTWQESARGNLEESQQFTALMVDARYLPLLGVEPLAGRLFDEENLAEQGAVVILNETAVRYFGYEGSYQDIIDLSFYEDSSSGDDYRIIGIVPDFHFNSLHHQVPPLVIFWDEENAFYANILMDMSQFAQGVRHVERVFNEFSGARLFQYQFMDELYGQRYTTERQLRSVFFIFTTFAILIASLGMLGLSSFMAERRLREMAVRKVMGAQMNHMVYLMLIDFLKLLGLAFLIAAPVSWLLLSDWLNGFPYRIHLGFYPFLAAALITGAVTVLTVAYHAIKVSLVNPGTILKYE